MHRHSITALLGLVLLSVTTAEAQPSLSKVFTPNTIGPGSVSTITFTITNGSAAPVSDLAFTDVLPMGPGPMTLADPANASTDCDLGLSGSLTAPDGGTTLTLSGGRIGGNQSCIVKVDVTAATPGAHTNPAVTLSSSAGSSMSLPVDLTVDTTRPGFSKAFVPDTVPLGRRSTLIFTIDNSLNAARVGSLDFSDVLPTGLEIADPSRAATDCINVSAPSTTVIAVPGTGSIVLDANGSNLLPGLEVLPAGATCTVAVDVVATGAGRLENYARDLVSDLVSSGRANAALDVTRTTLALRKSFIDDPTPPGSAATLEFTVDNFDRSFSATGIAFSDDLTTLVPALPGLTFGSLLSSTCGGSVSGVGTSSINFSGGTLAPQGSCTIRVSLAVPAAATPNAYLNTTSAVTGNVDGSPVTGNMAGDILLVEPVPILTKEFLTVGTLAPNPIVNPGDDVILRFTVTNPSTTSTATDITFIDELTDGGPGTGFLPFPILAVLPPTACGGGSLSLVIPDIDRHAINLTGGSLAAAPGPGDSCTFDLTLTIPATMPPGVYTNTTGAPSATIDGATRLGSPASDTLTVIAAPSLTKVFADDPVPPGGTVTLEFTLSYPADASGDATGITFTDDLANMTPALAGLVATGLPLAGACDPDGPGGVAGTGTLSGSAGDTLLTFSGGTLSPGQSCTLSVSLSVPAGATPSTYTNTTSTVSATVEGLPATSAEATDQLNVSGLTFTKEFLPDTVIPGESVTLRFSIANIHPTDDATITLFTDNLSAVLTGLAATGPAAGDTCGGTLSGTTFLIYTGGSVLSGQTCTIEVPVLVPAAAVDGTYTNLTSILLTSVGTIAPAFDELTVSSTWLQLDKSFTDDPVAPGDTVTVEYTLTNLDAARAASAVAFADDLGSALSGLTIASVLGNTCGGTVNGAGTDMLDVSGVSLAAAASCTVTLSLTVPGAATAAVYPSTTGAVTATIAGLPVTGTPASDDLQVLQLIPFSKSFDGPTTATGTATLTFSLTNPGSDPVSNLAFSDDLSNVLTGLVAISLPILPCGASSSITGTSFLAFTGGELPGGGSCSFDVEVLVPATAAAGSYSNTTSVLAQGGLQVAEPATADLVIEPPPTFAKAFAPTSVLAGGVTTLTFTVDNTASAVAADNLAFVDNFPAALLVATPANISSTCGGTPTAVAGSTVLTGGSVAAGATCTVSVDVTSSVVGMHANLTENLTSTSGNSGTAGATLTVGETADISISKTDGVTSAVIGGTVTYTIVVSNAGPSTDPAVTVSDTLPVDLTCTYTSVATGGATGNTVAGSGDIADTVSMPAGSSVTYTAGCDIADNASGTLSNTAAASGSLPDPVPGDNSATDDDTALRAEPVVEVPTSDAVGLAILMTALGLLGLAWIRRRLV